MGDCSVAPERDTEPTMSALLLLMIPLIALAAYRVLSARGIAKLAAAAIALAVAVAVTAAPAWTLRPKPSRGSPLETPVGPGFAASGGRVELLVDYVSGWSEPVQVAGRTVRRLTGHGQLAVGPLQVTRPSATLSFDASAPRRARLVVSSAGKAVTTAQLGPRLTRVAVQVPAGSGPAVLSLDLGSGTIVVPVASVHAVVR